METVETEFTNNDDAVDWAEKQGMTVIMSSLKDGKVTLKVLPAA